MVGHDDYHQTYKRMSIERRVAKNMKIYAGVGLGPNAERLMVLREPVGTPVQLAFDMIKESKRNVGEKETIEIFRALRSGIIQTVDNFTLMGVNIDPYQMIITDGNEILSPGDIHNTFMDLNAQSTKNVRYLKMWSLLYQNAVSIFGEAHPETVAIGVKVSEMKSLVDKERK
ncbi:hypothetical protein ROZALSC1DRAFT_22468 [Rozella allomycis CSF55]|nr:hypothetical protein ROZALSC1DRAFT_22468 [Rozella allomycis CSF55]